MSGSPGLRPELRPVLQLLQVLQILLLLQKGDCTESEQTRHLSSYQLTVPRPITGRLRRDVDGRPPSQVSYVITVDGTNHVVHLERNQLLLPADFTVYTYSQSGRVTTATPPAQNHCQYSGSVQDMEGSAVALSICNGLRGVLHLSEHSYAIEPLDSSPEQHLVYRLQDVTSQARGCGTPHHTHTHTHTHHTHTHTHHTHTHHNNKDTEHGHREEEETQHGAHSRVKRAVFHKTHYVELLLVVDNERYNFMKRNDSAVTDDMVHLANYIDSIYVQLNIRVVLVGVEIWSQQNLISTEGGAGEVLSRFTQWRERELVPRRRHDSAQLILRRSFGPTAGMAFVSTVCSRSHGGGINAFTSSSLASFSSIVAHELGHNLGMNHDDGRSCSCAGGGGCIMNSGATGSMNFSSCSADDFEKLLLVGGGACLLNQPRPGDAYSAPFCGNGLLDLGEDCDCGGEQECERDPCCEFQTCKLKSGAQCASGECCYNCQFLPGGSVCRPSTDECDLPEFCNGSSSFCQSDTFIQNGQPCRKQQAYCYNGKCQHLDGQCRAIFGPKATAAPDVCFKDVNSKGDRFGNCGYLNYGYRKCESRNAGCGKLQCSNVQSVTVFGIEPSIITSPLGGTRCYGVDYRLGSDVPDPGMVQEGTRCGVDQVCINFECRSSDVLNYDCDTERKCHGHGVCNSNRNCHCDPGWEPPFCEVKGHGGSVDSGPTWNDKDTSLRDGLLIFFLLVLPLLALGAAALTHLRRSRRRAGGAASTNPSRAAPPRAPPPVARGDANIRDGVQLLPAPAQVESSRPRPPHALRPPPPPLKPKPAAAALLPQRPAPSPPV